LPYLPPLSAMSLNSSFSRGRLRHPLPQVLPFLPPIAVAWGMKIAFEMASSVPSFLQLSSISLFVLLHVDCHNLRSILPMDPSLHGAAAMGGQPAIDPPLVLPLVLQVFPLPGSSDPEEFHGGPPSRPNTVGIDVALSAHHAILLHFGGHGLHYDPRPQYVHSSPASHMGNVPYNYGGFFHTAPPPTTTVTTIMATAALLHIMGGTRLPKCFRRCMGGVMLLLGMYPRLCMVVGPFPRVMGGIPIVATSVAPSLMFAGSSLHPSLPQEDHRSSSGSDITMSFSSPG
jgi:hypothetical protein